MGSVAAEGGGSQAIAEKVLDRLGGFTMKDGSERLAKDVPGIPPLIARAVELALEEAVMHHIDHAAAELKQEVLAQLGAQDPSVLDRGALEAVLGRCIATGKDQTEMVAALFTSRVLQRPERVRAEALREAADDLDRSHWRYPAQWLRERAHRMDGDR